MVEVELKFEIEKVNLTGFLKKLSRLGFTRVRPRTLEKTTMFDNQENLMRSTNGRIRLRSGKDYHELSYKKPISRSNVKKEVEYETAISDPRIIKKILKTMGFQPTTSYERYRTTFKNSAGQIKVTVDEFPFTTFLELEAEGYEGRILKLARRLGLDPKKSISLSCDTLFNQWRFSKGLKPSPHLLFRSYAQ